MEQEIGTWVAGVTYDLLLRMALFSLCAIIAGAVAAYVVFRRSETGIMRSSFFALHALLAIAGTLFGCLWYFLEPAFAHDLLTALSALFIAGMAVASFTWGRIAIARSRDAFGRAWPFVLAYLPLYVVLLFWKTRQGREQKRMKLPILLADRPAIWTGIVAGILCGVLDRTAVAATEARIEAFFEAGYGFDLALQFEGAADLLAAIAAFEQKRLPENIDDVLVQTGSSASGPLLVRTFRFDTAPGESIGADDIDLTSVDEIYCDDPSMRRLLVQGAQFEEVFLDREETEFLRYRVTAETCQG